MCFIILSLNFRELNYMSKLLFDILAADSTGFILFAQQNPFLTEQ